MPRRWKRHERARGDSARGQEKANGSSLLSFAFRLLLAGSLARRSCLLCHPDGQQGSRLWTASCLRRGPVNRSRNLCLHGISSRTRCGCPIVLKGSVTASRGGHFFSIVDQIFSSSLSRPQPYLTSSKKKKKKTFRPPPSTPSPSTSCRALPTSRSRAPASPTPAPSSKRAPRTSRP